MVGSYRTRHILVGHSRLPGSLTVSPSSHGLIVFAHGSGSSRLSPRNTLVATRLNREGFATLLFDLLAEREAQDRRNVFDIPLLGERVVDAIQWLKSRPDLAPLPIGLFGASTGAAAALVAAAAVPEHVMAVVSRGGRPDLAGDALSEVRAPTLLIVGGDDVEVLALNRDAQARMRCPTRLAIVPGASHLFGEPGALEAVILAGADWFLQHLAPVGPGAARTDATPTQSPR